MIRNWHDWREQILTIEMARSHWDQVLQDAQVGWLGLRKTPSPPDLAPFATIGILAFLRGLVDSNQVPLIERKLVEYIIDVKRAVQAAESGIRDRIRKALSAILATPEAIEAELRKKRRTSVEFLSDAHDFSGEFFGSLEAVFFILEGLRISGIDIDVADIGDRMNRLQKSWARSGPKVAALFSGDDSDRARSAPRDFWWYKPLQKRTRSPPPDRA